MLEKDMEKQNNAMKFFEWMRDKLFSQGEMSHINPQESFREIL